MICGRKNMRRTFCCLSIFLGVVMMFTLFGCAKQKYELHFDGWGFESKKTAYAQGDRVTVYYKMIATDTDYNFWIDEDVAMSQDYNSKDGYVFSFIMPGHDVTLHLKSHNSMLPEQPESFRVTFVNNVETADVWVLPQTDENLKSSLWGTASAKNLEANTQCDIALSKADEQELYIVNIIDADHTYYSAKNLRLDDGYVIRFTTEDSKYDAYIEVLDADGAVLSKQAAFVGVFGAE